MLASPCPHASRIRLRPDELAHREVRVQPMPARVPLRHPHVRKRLPAERGPASPTEEHPQVRPHLARVMTARTRDTSASPGGMQPDSPRSTAAADPAPDAPPRLRLDRLPGFKARHRHATSRATPRRNEAPTRPQRAAAHTRHTPTPNPPTGSRIERGRRRRSYMRRGFRRTGSESRQVLVRVRQALGCRSQAGPPRGQTSRAPCCPPCRPPLGSTDS